jgi:hypothetical protein
MHALRVFQTCKESLCCQGTQDPGQHGEHENTKGETVQTCSAKKLNAPSDYVPIALY